MTRHLARLADISYRYRGRVVLAWIVSAVLIIAVGSALAGEFNAEYNTPGSESKAAADLTEKRFGGYSGQEIYVVAKDPAGFANAGGGGEAPAAVLRPGREGRAHRPAHLDPPLQEPPDRLDHPAAHRSRLGRDQVAGRAADQRRRRQQRRGPRDQARRRPDLPGAVAVQPGGARVPRRGDRPADRLRLARRRGPAAGDRADRARHLLRRPDPPARQRDRRPRLDHSGLRADRDRRRDRLCAPRPDPIPHARCTTARIATTRSSRP